MSLFNNPMKWLKSCVSACDMCVFQRVTCYLRTTVTPLSRSNMKKTTHVSPSFRKIHMVWPPSVGSLKILRCFCKRALYFRSTTHDLRKRDMYYLKKQFLILYYMVWPRSLGSLQDQAAGCFCTGKIARRLAFCSIPQESSVCPQKRPLMMGRKDNCKRVLHFCKRAQNVRKRDQLNKGGKEQGVCAKKP